MKLAPRPYIFLLLVSSLISNLYYFETPSNTVLLSSTDAQAAISRTCAAKSLESPASSHDFNHSSGKGALTQKARDYLEKRLSKTCQAADASRFVRWGTAVPVGSFQYQKPDRGGSGAEVLRRRAAIVEATRHAWDGYERKAFGWDELGPVSGRGKDTFGSGLGTTIVDSLGTLYLMGEMDRYEKARNWVENKLRFDEVEGLVNVFETVIRLLGGLLSAFHMTGDQMFAEKAEELGVRLAAALDTESGYPWPRCSLKNVGECSLREEGGGVFLAEVGSLQMEYRALSFHSTDSFVSSLSRVTDKIIDQLQGASSISGRVDEFPQLLPTQLSLKSGMFSSNLFTLGAPADSYFEYLIKMFVQSGRRERKFLKAFEGVVDGILGIASYTSKFGDTIVRDLIPSKAGLYYSHRMDHFSCFLPGVITLGVSEVADLERRKRWEDLAVNLTTTCHNMYARSLSGLSGESIRLSKDDVWRQTGPYNQRPEAVEAFFYMWRYTKDPKYREWAWEVFQAIERHCKTEYGYATLKNARSTRPRMEDHMHSFLISETFKYLYLIFEEDDVLPLDKWVFNTEAHPLLITPAMAPTSFSY